MEEHLMVFLSFFPLVQALCLHMMVLISSDQCTSGQGCPQCGDGSNRLYRWESYGNTMNHL